jgi:hypothetical protein
MIGNDQRFSDGFDIPAQLGAKQQSQDEPDNNAGNGNHV